MKVRDVMTPSPETCGPHTDVAACARLMWDGDFGFLPVVGNRGELLGVVTDRDLCMAVAMQDRRPGEILVREVMTRVVHRCMADDNVERALQLMKEHQVRRVPVTDAKGTVEGVVTLNDLAISAGETASRGGRPDPCPGSEVLAALKAICRHRTPAETV